MSAHSMRLAELSAEIQEIDRALSAHRTAAPGMDATNEDRAAWLARDNGLRAQLHQLQAEHTHLLAGGEVVS